MKRSEKDIVNVLQHVRYEIEMLCHPQLISDSVYINNALLESRLIHARSLIEFFSPKTHVHETDVRPEHFGFQSSDVGVDEDPVVRIHRDIAHISYDRLDRTPETKRWFYGTFMPPIAKRSLAFVRHVLKTFSHQMAPTEVEGWRALEPRLKTLAAASNAEEEQSAENVAKLMEVE